VRFSTVADVAAYVREPTGPLADVELLSPRSAQVEDVMLGMRLVAGVREEQVAATDLDDVLLGLADDGLVERARGVWRATQRGWLLGNEVAGRIWDAR
jgi:oxygen-independent coproporphyrinogen-3 oxidase